MFFFKLLLGLPLLVILLVFAFVNNDMTVFSLWPTNIEITVSQSVMIIALYSLGYIAGWFFTWLSYSPIRRALRNQKRQNRKITKEQEKLTKEVEGLRGNIDELKAAVPSVEEKNGIFNLFHKIFKPKDKESL